MIKKSRKKNINHKHILTIWQVSSDPHFWNLNLTDIFNYLPQLHSIFPSSLERISADFSGRVTHIFFLRNLLPLSSYLDYLIFIVSSCWLSSRSHDIVTSRGAVRISCTHSNIIFLTSIMKKQSNFALVIWINHPYNTITPFLACWLKNIRSPKWQGEIWPSSVV